MPDLLIVYSTVDGQTLRICERMKTVLEALGQRVTLASIDDHVPGLNAFDTIVIGASIRYGKHRPSVLAFLVANRRVLDRTPSAFFSVNIVARRRKRTSRKPIPTSANS